MGNWKSDDAQTELLRRAQGGDAKALNQLVSAYLPIAEAMARKLFSADCEDMAQEGLMALPAAVSSFDAEKGIPFSSYATVCLRNAMIASYRRSRARKRGGGEEKLPYLDGEDGADGASDPQQIVAQREQVSRLMKQAESVLSSFEKQVLSLHLDGYSYKDISRLLHKPEKSVDNALQRVRKKLKYAQ